ncbi:hypothetical protein V6N13_008137 [Hibiscus sabdariffa]
MRLKVLSLVEIVVQDEVTGRDGVASVRHMNGAVASSIVVVPTSVSLDPSTHVVVKDNCDPNLVHLRELIASTSKDMFVVKSTSTPVDGIGMNADTIAVEGVHPRESSPIGDDVMLCFGMEMPLVIGGDFNSIFSSRERLGGSARRSDICRKFRNFLPQANLIDLGFEGPCFTWKRGSLQQCLDRCVVNDAWCEVWPHSSVLHLACLGSDHIPVLLVCAPVVNRSKLSQFKYLAAWKSGASFSDLVKNVWQSDALLAFNIENFCKEVTS